MADTDRGRHVDSECVSEGVDHEVVEGAALLTGLADDGAVQVGWKPDGVLDSDSTVWLGNDYCPPCRLGRIIGSS